MIDLPPGTWLLAVVEGLIVLTILYDYLLARRQKVKEKGLNRR